MKFKAAFGHGLMFGAVVALLVSTGFVACAPKHKKLSASRDRGVGDKAAYLEKVDKVLASSFKNKNYDPENRTNMQFAELIMGASLSADVTGLEGATNRDAEEEVEAEVEFSFLFINELEPLKAKGRLQGTEFNFLHLAPNRCDKKIEDYDINARCLTTNCDHILVLIEENETGVAQRNDISKEVSRRRLGQVAFIFQNGKAKTGKAGKSGAASETGNAGKNRRNLKSSKNSNKSRGQSDDNRDDSQNDDRDNEEFDRRRNDTRNDGVGNDGVGKDGVGKDGRRTYQIFWSGPAYEKEETGTQLTVREALVERDKGVSDGDYLPPETVRCDNPKVGQSEVNTTGNLSDTALRGSQQQTEIREELLNLPEISAPEQGVQEKQGTQKQGTQGDNPVTTSETVQEQATPAVTTTPGN